eukprot:4942618-Prymnesium_polylepis.1
MRETHTRGRSHAAASLSTTTDLTSTDGILLDFIRRATFFTQDLPGDEEAREAVLAPLRIAWQTA